MVATLATATPVADFALNELVIASPTAEFFDVDTREIDCSPLFIPEQEVAESESSSAKSAAATRTAPDAAAATTDLIAAAVVLIAFAGAFLTIGEYARDVYDKLANFSPFELFRLLNVIP